MTAEGKVIRPPMEDIAKGKVFSPDTKFRNKMWFMGVFVAIMIWVMIVVVILLGNYYVFFAAVGGGWPAFWNSFFNMWWYPVNFWYWVITAIWLLPGVIVVPIYLNSIEYSVIAKSGETMPEIYVKKGIINITRKHVPFRTITNISSRAGPFDRLFGIGSIEIETAGHSGSSQMGGPEEKLEGLVFYEELRDFILRELRKFKDPYVTGTEVVFPEEEGISTGPTDIEKQILRVLADIRDLLRNRE